MSQRNDDNFEELDNDENTDIHELMDDYDLDEDEAEQVKNIMDEDGLDEDEAVELKDAAINSGGGGGVIGFIVFILIIWGLFSLFSNDDENTAVMQEHPNYTSYEESKDCSI